MSNEYALEIRNVSKRFGGITATDHVNIAVKKGEIFGIIGPNGAGKTTLFNMITGVYGTTEGEIFMNGVSLADKLPYQISRAGLARTFQNIRLFNDLSVYENVHIAYQNQLKYNILQGVFKTPKYRKSEKECEEFCTKLLKSVGLWEMRMQIASNLPYGAQRRLEIVRALATNPQILLLDEPAAGMNEEESKSLSAIIRNIRNSYADMTILIIDHHMDVIMEVCDRITVINFGRQITTGIPSEIQKNQEVIDAYLGVDE